LDTAATKEPAEVTIASAYLEALKDRRMKEKEEENFTEMREDKVVRIVGKTPSAEKRSARLHKLCPASKSRKR
jgi:hypothetical protein